MGTFNHWVLYGIPAEVTELEEDLPNTKEMENEMRQGENNFRKIGYGGPCPPGGAPHEYIFKLYSLSGKPIVSPGVEKRELIGEIDEFLIATTKLMAKYERE